jgi:cobaltochelatase CobT
MSGNDQGKAEDFKRATASALRAIAQTPDVQVAYQPGPSGLSGKRARLPSPSRALAPAEMAKLRGVADSLALRLRHHDDAVHSARAPATREAREAYDALEQARIEIIGATHMAGVSANLRGKLNDECETGGLDRMTKRDQLPLVTALSLLARDRMDPASVPEAAKQILALWRDTLGVDAEAALTELAAVKADQVTYTRAARKLLAALELAEAEADTADEDDSESDDDDGEDSADQNNAQDGESDSQSDDKAMLAAQPEMMQGEAAEQRRPGRSRDGRRHPVTSRRATAPIPAPMMKKSTPMLYVTRKNSAGSGNSLIISCSTCMPWWPNSPIACSGACWRNRRVPGSLIWKKGCWIPPGYHGSSSIRSWR